jgi:hypothetical protein
MRVLLLAGVGALTRHVLQHVPNRHRALERMAAAVKPGGWLVVEDVDILISTPDQLVEPDVASLEIISVSQAWDSRSEFFRSLPSAGYARGWPTTTRSATIFGKRFSRYSRPNRTVITADRRVCPTAPRWQASGMSPRSRSASFFEHLAKKCIEHILELEDRAMCVRATATSLGRRRAAEDAVLGQAHHQVRLQVGLGELPHLMGLLPLIVAHVGIDMLGGLIQSLLPAVAT